MLLLYWPFSNNRILLLLKLSSCSFSNSLSFSRNLTCSIKSSNCSNNEGSEDSFFFCFISFKPSSSCFVITKLLLQSPIISNTFSQPCCLFLKVFQVFRKSYLSSLFSDFKKLLRTSFLVNLIFLNELHFKYTSNIPEVYFQSISEVYQGSY